MAAPTISFIEHDCRVDGAEFDDILPVMIANATSASQGQKLRHEPCGSVGAVVCCPGITPGFRCPTRPCRRPEIITEKHIFLDGPSLIHIGSM